MRLFLDFRLTYAEKGMFKPKREGGWMLATWHGMRFLHWWALLRRNGFRITANCVPRLLTITSLSLVNEVLCRLSELLYARKARGIQVADPIFIIGHWRTGTTWMHELLSRDARLAFPDSYQAIFPSHFLLSGAWTGWMHHLLPKTRPMDDVPVGLERPQEDEFALCNLGLRSPYLSMAFPRSGPCEIRYLDLQCLSRTERQQWIDGYFGYLRRLTLAKGGPLLLKSPAHTARIPVLLEMFPQARFIYLARDPYKVFASTRHMWKCMNSVQGLQNPAGDDAWLEEYVLDTFERLYQAYSAARPLIPVGRLAEVRYEDLVSDPKAALRGIYGELGLGDFEEAEEALDACLEESRGYRSRVHCISEEQAGRVRQRWAGYIEGFGYGEGNFAPRRKAAKKIAKET